MPQKHAYCIIAHNEPIVLATLVRMVDDVRNDVFIHIDKKHDLNIFQQEVRAKYSQLFFIEERLSCNWGDISQIKCEMLLMKYAQKNGDYSYFHLLSGVDLPLHSQNYIHHFFEENDGMEFIGFDLNKDSVYYINYKTNYYHIAIKYLRHGNHFVRFFSSKIQTYFIALQQLMGVKRNTTVEFRKGCNWASLTGKAVSYILSKEAFINRTFRYTWCCDEIYKQTLLYNSSFKYNLYRYGSGEYEECLRLIDWERGEPYVWRSDDIELLKHSDYIFARKFSSSHFQVIEDLEKWVCNSNNE